MAGHPAAGPPGGPGPTRGGAGASRDDLPDELRALLDGTASTCSTDLTIDVSSTEIRSRLAAGEPLGEDWLHPRVLNYLEKYRFYR